MAIAMGWLGSLIITVVIAFLLVAAVAVLIAGWLGTQADDLRQKIEEGEEE